MKRWQAGAILFFLGSTLLRAADPADNATNLVRRVPPPGITISAADRADLQTRVGQLGQEIDILRSSLTNQPALIELLPDVEILHKAVQAALVYDEFYLTNEVGSARRLLGQGRERAAALQRGETPWLSATGLVVRGYRSRIDGSVQPYGLVVPRSYTLGAPGPFRLDVWFHGRGEKLSELSFLAERQRSAGEFAPAHAFVLHPYGRYCNANKFAGETDLFEALEGVRARYPIDENRIVVRGFSMGGAACWQFAVHYADRWAAAAPGAGFAETADFLKIFQNERVAPAWYEQRLWHWYDCPDYAVNLFHCPTVAYSGEVDRQKQAADVMARALGREGIELVHIIGPGTAHRYHPAAKEEINRRIDQIAARGRDPLPRKVRFTTWTLRYPKMHWLILDGLEEHWRETRAEGEIVSDHRVLVKTTNVTALTLSMPPGWCPLDPTRRAVVELDGQALAAAPVASDRSWSAHFQKAQGRWQAVASRAREGLRKRHGLQGPIDDTFMDSFLMVTPTGAPLNGPAAEWIAREQARAIDHWRRQFRGDARVKPDSDVTDADIARHHLVLWGDPQSNRVLARVAPRLPVRWDRSGVHTPDAVFPLDRYVPVLIYPNPLNPERYVVLNSGFTFREYDYLNNARQVPKLPDFAIIDISVPASPRAAGGIAAAGFFGEQWEWQGTLSSR